MSWGLYLFLAWRRLRAGKLLVGVVALALASSVAIVHAAATPGHMLTVADFDLNPSTGDRVLVFAGKQQVAEASVFNGSISADGSARFRLPPGEYVIYIGNAQNDIRSMPSGPLRSASFTVLLDQDRTLDVRRELAARGSGYNRGEGF